MSYTLTQSELTGLITKLTRAINSGDSAKVLSAVENAYAIFEEKGWPDDWSRWERAKEDFRAYKSDPYWVYA
jgi:hypothetical protein